MSFQRFKEKKKEKASLREVCDLCGKPVSTKGSSSLTSWIFQDSFCKCKKSQPLASPLPTGSSEGAARDFVVAASGSASTAEHSLSEEKQQCLFELTDRYEVLEVLGEGGMGTVYKARDKALGKNFAIKVLHADLAHDKAAAKRFEQESKMARDLTHPNLVAVYDDGISEAGAPFLVMDYIDGKTLAEILKQEVFIDQTRAIDLLLQISEAVAHAHIKGVIHRDLKPSNIILTTNENGAELAHVTDFGIAKVLAAAGMEGQGLTQTGDVFGSPLYMSPEQCEGDKLDVRSDVYSLGCVMYEMLTGKPPFVGANPIKTIMKHIQEAPPAFPKHLEISEALETITMHCLEKDPALRYQTVQEFVIDLIRVLDGVKPLAHAPSHTLVARGDDSQPDGEEAIVIHPSAQSQFRVYRFCAFLSSAFLLFMIMSCTNSDYLGLGLLLFVPLNILGRTWQLQEEVVQASRLIGRVSSTKVMAKLEWNLWNSLLNAVLEVPSEDPKSKKSRKYMVTSQRKHKTFLRAAADGKLKEYRVCADPDTGKPVALNIGDHTFVLTEQSPFGICTRFDPLVTFIRRIGATLIDGLILSLPFALAWVMAAPLSAAFGLGSDAEIVRGVSLLFMSLSVINVFFPVAMPVVGLVSILGALSGAEIGPLASLFSWNCLLAILSSWIYQACFESSERKATPGKQLFRLFATTDSGARMPLWRTAVRPVVKFTTVAILFVIALPFMGFAGTGGKEFSPQSLLDIVCATSFLSFLVSALRRKQQLCHDFCSFTTVRQQVRSKRLTVIACFLSLFAASLAFNSFGLVKANGFNQFARLLLEEQIYYAKARLAKAPNGINDLLLRARAHYYSQNFDKALEEFQHVCKIDPKNAAALCGLADCLAEKGEYKQASALLNQSIKLQPTLDAYVSRGIVNLCCSSPGQAANDFKAAAELDKGSGLSGALVLAPIAYRMDGNETAAKGLISKAFQESHIYPIPPNTVFYFLNRQFSGDTLLHIDSEFSNWNDRRSENRCIIALDLVQKGQRDEALKLLRDVKKSASPYMLFSPQFRAGMHMLRTLEAEAP